MLNDTQLAIARQILNLGGKLDTKFSTMFIEEVESLQQQNKQMKEKLEWAARIIDSGMYGGALRYDPLLWFKEYHELIQGGPSNAVGS